MKYLFIVPLILVLLTIYDYRTGKDQIDISKLPPPSMKKNKSGCKHKDSRLIDGDGDNR